ncbi:MAG: hypothetical protein P8X55_06870 [Desulfosarcinaceae bacterium]
MQDLTEVCGEKWLVTDFQEALSRLMTVEGPVKYAELLVRRKLQESGEFEEPVQIIPHWKKKRGRNATDIFFTAVPARLADFYFQVLRRQADVTMVVPMYALMWGTLKQLRSGNPAAVVLRHGRFADVLIGDQGRIYFANRCVAFDTEPEQLQALWQTVLADITDAETEHRIKVGKVVCLNWLEAEARPLWPDDMLARVVTPVGGVLAFEGTTFQNAWPATLDLLSLQMSASPLADKCCYAANRLSERAALEQEIRAFRLEQPKPANEADFKTLLGFIHNIDERRRLPEYRKIIADLTEGDFPELTLERLKIDYGGDKVNVELFGDIQAPFDTAHGGYQELTRRLRQRGYKIVENKFETQISSSKIVLKFTGSGV